MIEINKSANARREKLARKLAAYSVAAGTGLIAVESTNAAVIPFKPPAPIVYDASIAPFSEPIDINDDGFKDFDIRGDYFYLGSGYLGSFRVHGNFAPGMAVFIAGGYLARIFAPGELIESGSTYTFGILDHFSQTRGYVGVRFRIPGGSSHYGYLDVEVSGSTDEFVTIYGGAYESLADTPILAGAIPEPAGLAMLASGAAGLATWRRRKLA